MAARRGKNQARRSGQARRSSLTWLAAGLAIGGLVFGYLHFKGERPLDSLLPTPDPNARAHPPSSEDAVAEVSERPKPKYDFYDILPGKEVVIPDAELAAQARAEAAKAAEVANAAEDAADVVAEAPPSETLALDRDRASTTATAPGAATAVPAPPAAVVAPPKGSGDGPKYLIQAGAFLGSNEADALKAQIAMTGEVARVEVAEINGKTVHRVRMGPYPNASALAAAKAALAAHGIDAQAIRVK